MANVPEQHRQEAPSNVGCAVVTVSDTRTLETDVGGRTAVELLEAAGHGVRLREIVPDEPEDIRRLLAEASDRDDIDAVLITGGTGLGGRDRTFETVVAMLQKQLPGYGELFRMLSYRQIGAAAMLSRAVGGLIDRTVVLTMPGSPAAVQLAVEKLIVPELGHLVREARR